MQSKFDACQLGNKKKTPHSSRSSWFVSWRGWLCFKVTRSQSYLIPLMFIEVEAKMNLNIITNTSLLIFWTVYELSCLWTTRVWLEKTLVYVTNKQSLSSINKWVKSKHNNVFVNNKARFYIYILLALRFQYLLIG